jgi:hypothetical protein
MQLINADNLMKKKSDNAFHTSIERKGPQGSTSHELNVVVVEMGVHGLNGNRNSALGVYSFLVFYRYLS